MFRSKEKYGIFNRCVGVLLLNNGNKETLDFSNTMKRPLVLEGFFLTRSFLWLSDIVPSVIHKYPKK